MFLPSAQEQAIADIAIAEERAREEQCFFWQYKYARPIRPLKEEEGTAQIAATMRASKQKPYAVIMDKAYKREKGLMYLGGRHRFHKHKYECELKMGRMYPYKVMRDNFGALVGVDDLRRDVMLANEVREKRSRRRRMRMQSPCCWFEKSLMDITSGEIEAGGRTGATESLLGLPWHIVAGTMLMQTMAQ